MYLRFTLQCLLWVQVSGVSLLNLNAECSLVADWFVRRSHIIFTGQHRSNLYFSLESLEVLVVVLSVKHHIFCQKGFFGFFFNQTF